MYYFKIHHNLLIAFFIIILVLTVLNFLNTFKTAYMCDFNSVK